MQLSLDPDSNASHEMPPGLDVREDPTLPYATVYDPTTGKSLFSLQFYEGSWRFSPGQLFVDSFLPLYGPAIDWLNQHSSRPARPLRTYPSPEL